MDGALLTHYTFLMFKRKSDVRVQELAHITSYGDLVPESGTIEVTTLRDGMAKYIEDIKDAGGGITFEINYTNQQRAKLKQLKELGEELDFEVWFGATGSGASLVPTGHDGAFSFSGRLTYQVTGAGTRAARPSAIVLFPSTDVDDNEAPIYQLASAPSAPQNLAAVVGDQQVSLTWIAPGNDGGSPISGYEVSRDNGLTWVAPTTTTSHTFTGLTNGQEYTFVVRANNELGTGVVATVKATPATVPGEPTNFVANAGDSLVGLTWAAPLSNGGSPITDYEVSSDDGVTWVTPDTATSHTFTGLTNDTPYTFQVRAINAIGNGLAATATATPTAV